MARLTAIPKNPVAINARHRVKHHSRRMVPSPGVVLRFVAGLTHRSRVQNASTGSDSFPGVKGNNLTPTFSAGFSGRSFVSQVKVALLPL